MSSRIEHVEAEVREFVAFLVRDDPAEVVALFEAFIDDAVDKLRPSAMRSLNDELDAAVREAVADLVRKVPAQDRAEVAALFEAFLDDAVEEYITDLERLFTTERLRDH